MKRSNAISLILFAVVFTASAYKKENGNNEVSVARTIMHKVDWISIATISTLEKVKGYPFNNLKSVSDGPKFNGTGIPYLLMTDMDLSGADVKVNNAVTLMATLAEKTDCSKKHYDPQDPRCGRLIITGRLVEIDNKTQEHEFAKNALFERHPVMRVWVKVHTFYFAKVNIENILLLDHFGGAVNIDVQTYMKAAPPVTWIEKMDGKTDATPFFFNSL